MAVHNKSVKSFERGIYIQITRKESQLYSPLSSGVIAPGWLLLARKTEVWAHEIHHRASVPRAG